MAGCHDLKGQAIVPKKKALFRADHILLKEIINALHFVCSINNVDLPC